MDGPPQNETAIALDDGHFTSHFTQAHQDRTMEGTNQKGQ